MTDRRDNKPMARRFRRAILTLCAAVAIITTATGCSSGSDEEIIANFTKDVNSSTKSSGIYAGELEDGTIYLSMRLKETPENLAKVKILGSDESAQEAFSATICKSLDEGDLLACFIRQKRNLAFQVEAGELGYYITFTPQEIRDIAFKKK